MLPCFPSCALDVIKERLEFIRQIGADVTVLAGPDDEPELTAQRVVAVMGKEPEVSIECSGSQSGINTAVFVREKQERFNLYRHSWV